MNQNQNQTTTNKRGSGLIFATLIMFVILMVVISLSSITVMEMKMSQKTKSSVKSFFNAESGVEWALNKIATTDKETIEQAFNDSNPSDGINCPFGGNECKIYLLDSANNVITSGSTKLSEVKAVRSVGTSEKGYETQRAIEAAVAGGGDLKCVSKSKTWPRNTKRSYTIRCDTGYIATGGGCDATHDTRGELQGYHSHPVGNNGWYCFAGDFNSLVGAYVRCCKIE